MANNDITVDEFVKTKVLPKFQPIVEELRTLIRQTAPELQEVMSYGIPNYRGRRGVAVISPAKTYITLAFSRGAEFEDKYSLLEGVGKVSKNVRFRDVSDINKEALRYYIKQALKFDAE
jgi:hypothetical protein